MFVKGDKDLDFGQVLPVINDGHAAGVDNIGIVTPRGRVRPLVSVSERGGAMSIFIAPLTFGR